MPNPADAEREVSQVASSHGGTGGSSTPRGGYVPCAQQCAELSGDYSEHMGDDESDAAKMPMSEEEEEEEEKVSNDSNSPFMTSSRPKRPDRRRRLTSNPLTRAVPGHSHPRSRTRLHILKLELLLFRLLLQLRLQVLMRFKLQPHLQAQSHQQSPS